MKRNLFTIGILCFLTAATTVFGQTGNGQIGGIVQDPSKALIPGVTITMTNVATGVVSTQVSNESGAYSFASVPPGTYRLSAGLPGFKTSIVNELPVGTSAQVRWDFTMQIGEVTSQVEVSVSAQQMLTESAASIGEVLPEQRARDLPLVSGDVLDLVRIMPGFQIDPIGEQFSVMGGLPVNTINTTRDGISVTSGRTNNGIFAVTTMNPDLVGEIRVILSPVDAEVGRGNGQIQIQTRSGTNRYTGSAVWNVRNTGLNANTWENNRTINGLTGRWEPTRPDWRNTHQYTVSYGGPVIKNKTFFFALWDQNISNTRQLISNTVLTDTARKGIFRYWEGWNSGNALTPVPTFPASVTGGTYPGVDFGGNPLRPPYNTDGTPYTGNLRCYSVFGNLKTDGSPFTAADCPGGIAIVNNGPWDPLRPTMDTTGYVAKLIDAMPHANFFAPAGTAIDGLNQAVFRWVRGRSGNTGGGAQNGTTPEVVNRKQFNIKIDQNFNARNRLAVSWTYQQDDNADNVANWPGGIHGDSRRRPQVFTMNFTSTLSPAIVNEARYGVSLDKIEINPPWYSSNSNIRTAAEEWLLKGGKSADGKIYPIAFTPGTGNYAFGNAIISAGSTYSGSSSPLHSLADTMSWTRGAHSFRMGAEVRLIHSSGYSGSVFPTASGGAGGNAANALANANASLPNELGTTRTNSANMLYLLSGSVNTASMIYWIGSDEDVKNGTWQDWSTNTQRLRTSKSTELAFFWKDDWKATQDLTVNLGLRYERYGSPYLDGGFTASVADQGYGLFGAGRTTADPFDRWLVQPGNLYLSGYGSNAGANSLQCTTGTANPNGLPASTCDPTKVTRIEFVGPGSDQPGKVTIPNDNNNFGPAVGFAWTLPWFGKGKTTIRGGYQITFGGAGLNPGGALETLLGNAPGASSTANTVLADFPQLTTNRAITLVDLPALVPVKPTSPALPGGQAAIYSRNTNFTAYDPEFATPYTQNLTLSVTRSMNRYTSLDVRYTGTLGMKRQGSYNINLPNVFYNKELFDAIEITRRGEDAPLFDEMFAGLNVSGQTTGGYGAVGTVVGNVMQRGSAHLRRNNTFSGNLADGNFAAVASSLNTLGGTAVTGLTQLQPLPAGLTGVGGRALRNGCDRIANGLTSIPTRCFPENYIVANPQLGTPTYNANLADSDYHGMQVQFNLRPILGISNQTTYTFSKLFSTMPRGWNDPLNRNADYTLPFQDVRHDFRFNGIVELPIGPNKALFGNSSGWVARLIERWQTAMTFTWASGNPRTVAAGVFRYATGENNLDQGQNKAMIVSSLYDERMDGNAVWDGPNHNTGTYWGTGFVRVEDPQCQVANKPDSMGFNLYANGSCGLNAIAMKNPDGAVGSIVLQNPFPGQVGNHPLSLSTVGKWRFDANLSKTFRLTESKSLQFRMDVQNVMNHPDLTEVEPGVSQTINDETREFGRIATKQGTGAGSGPRSFNASLRVTF